MSILIILIIIGNFFTIHLIKEEKKKSKINVNELENLSKEEIIKYIKMKQQLNQKLYYTDYIFLAISILSYASGIAVTYYLFCLRKQANQRVSKEELLSIFPIKYRKVIEELVNSNGEMAQAILRQKLGMDKVQMTRLIKRMEEEGFVIVKRGSKINYIELNDALKKLFNIKK